MNYLSGGKMDINFKQIFDLHGEINGEHIFDLQGEINIQIIFDLHGEINVEHKFDRTKRSSDKSSFLYPIFLG